MVQRSQYFGFTLKAVNAIGIPRNVFRQDLDRHFTLQLQVTGTIHLTHTAFTEQSGDLV
jgi:hypothetical protein